MLHSWFESNYSSLDWTEDYKLVLLGPSYIPSTSHSDFSDLTDEITSSNYPASGYTLTDNVAVTGSTYYFKTATVVCTELTTVVKHAIIYKVSNGKLIASYDFGKGVALTNSTLKLVWLGYAFSSTQTYDPLIKTIKPRAPVLNNPRWMSSAYPAATLESLIIDASKINLDLPSYSLLDPQLAVPTFYFTAPKSKPEQTVTIKNFNILQNTKPIKTDSINNIWDDLIFNYGEDEAKYYFSPSLIFTWYVAQPSSGGIISFNTLPDSPKEDSPIYIITSRSQPVKIDYSSILVSSTGLDIGYTEQVVIGFYSNTLYQLALAGSLTALVDSDIVNVSLVPVENYWDGIAKTYGLTRYNLESNTSLVNRILGLTFFEDLNGKLAATLGQYSWVYQDATTAFSTGSMWLASPGRVEYENIIETPVKVGNVLYLKYPILNKPKVYFNSNPISTYTYNSSSIILTNYSSGNPSQYVVNYKASYFDITSTSVGVTWPALRIIAAHKAVKLINSTKKLNPVKWNRTPSTYNHSSTYI